MNNSHNLFFMDEKIMLLIKKHALHNALSFNGKASVGAVIGKLIAEMPDIKPRIKEITKTIQKVVSEINSMHYGEQKKELEKIAPELLEKKEKKEKDLPDLPNVQGSITTRMPPEPSKYLHIGHALSFLINYVYAKKYNGKCILRFEDTNPEKSKQEYVDSIKQDIDYLGINSDKEIFVSDDMELFYEMAEQLIRQNKAYVCFCPKEKISKLRQKAEECECRNNTAEQNISYWKEMLNNKYDEGKAVLRLKISMSHKNYAMRDPIIMRISKAEHYRHKSKYVVWPLYDFENAIEDSLCEITHVLRSNEFGKMRIELQDYIKSILGLKKQTIVQYGRFNIHGAITQGREIREKIENGQYIGWDDPRLVTLKALRRRGFVKEMFYELVKQVGLSKSPTNIDFTILSSINRKIVDNKVDRYFFIKDPVKITIKNAPKQNIELDLNPNKKNKGRKFSTSQEFFIEKQDYDGFVDNEIIRLMDCLNFRKTGSSFEFISLDYFDFKGKGKKIIHWLPAQSTISISIRMPDNSIITGLAEQNIENIAQDQLIQFERFGFCKLDNREKKEFWFTHK